MAASSPSSPPAACCTRSGFVVLATRRPNPWPATFGYHEVFHTFVVLAALCHWVALYLLVTR